MFAVLRATGLRRGELLILKVDDINFATNVLRVVRRPDSKQDSRSSLGFVEISRPRRGSGRTQGRLPACRGCNHWSSYCEQQDPPQALVRLSKPELASKAIRPYTEHCERPGSARSGLHGDNLVEPTNALPVDLDCNCTCPGCGAKLLLRQGARWTHFAHYNANTSDNCVESAIHAAALDLCNKVSATRHSLLNRFTCLGAPITVPVLQIRLQIASARPAYNLFNKISKKSTIN